MHFSIVKINPPDAPPAHGFDDAILPLFHSLRRLGYATEILFNRTNQASRNIVFGSCMSPRATGRMLPKGSIIFNLEQINRDSKWCNANYLTHLGDYQVWDYSPANVRDLEKLKIRAAHVPLGYVPEMVRLNRNFPPLTDLLFYGLITERRQLVLDEIMKYGTKLLASQEAFGDLRDRLLAGSRLVLNLHNYTPARLEVVRLGYVWANKKPVLSEREAGTEVPAHLEEACFFANREEIPAAAARLLADSTLLETQAEKGFKAFSSNPMEEDLAKIIGRRVFAGSRKVARSSDAGMVASTKNVAVSHCSSKDLPTTAAAEAPTPGGTEKRQSDTRPVNNNPPPHTSAADKNLEAALHPAYHCRKVSEWLILGDFIPEDQVRGES